MIRRSALLFGCALLLGGCGNASATLSGHPPADLPSPAGIRVAFNYQPSHHYRSPVSGQWRQGDDLEAMVLEAITGARQQILVAVQELSLPRVAQALLAAQGRGVQVRVVLENTYSTPWSEQHPADLNPHQRLRQAQLQALGQPDAVALLRQGGVPLLDDTADGSSGSGVVQQRQRVGGGTAGKRLQVQVGRCALDVALA
jgi:hypothetical protein